MAAPKSSSKTRSKWERIIAAGEASGLTAAEYCRKHGIKPKLYSMWKGKLREAGVELSAPEKVQSSEKAARRGKGAPASKSAVRPNRTISSRSRAVDRPTSGAAPSVDLDAYLITATLLNGLVVEIKCPGETELSLALQHLASL